MAADLDQVQGTFTVTREADDISSDLSVTYSVSATATESVDYQSLTGTVTIPAGQTSAPIGVTPIADGVLEDDETVTVTLVDEDWYHLYNSWWSLPSATVTILDDKPIVSIEATDPAAAEDGADPGQFTVSRTGGTTEDLVVYYTVPTAGGSEVIADGDYVGLPGCLVMPAGSASATIDLVPINDILAEAAEEVQIVLASGDNCAHAVQTQNGTVEVVFPGPELPGNLTDQTMNVLIRWPLLSGLGLACAAFAALEGSAGNQGVRAETEISWGSPKMREIENEYKSLWATYNNSPEKIGGGDLKSKYGAVLRLVDRLFRKRVSGQNIRQLAASCDTLPVDAEHRSQFANDLLAFMVKALVELEERDTLVSLLSTRCPGRVGGHTTIEFHLAYWGRALEDPILILGDAYSKCQVPDVRHDIAAAVRRGFAGLGIRGKNDAEFVANAMQWYEQEKDHLVVNREFWRNEVRIELEVHERRPEFYDQFPDGMTRELLFEKKLSSAEQPHHDLRPRQVPRRSTDNGTATSTPESGIGQVSDNEPETLEGTWQVTEVTHNGHVMPQDRIKGARWIISRKTLTWIVPLEEKQNEEQEFRISFPERQPDAIDLISTGGPRWKQVETTPLIRELLVEITPAIYESKENSLRICLAMPGAYQRPTSFRAEEGSNWTLITLKRVSMVGPASVIGILATLVAAAALLFWPKRGLYWRWKRKATARSQFGEPRKGVDSQDFSIAHLRIPGGTCRKLRQALGPSVFHIDSKLSILAKGSFFSIRSSACEDFYRNAVRRTAQGCRATLGSWALRCMPHVPQRGSATPPARPQRRNPVGQRR